MNWNSNILSLMPIPKTLLTLLATYANVPVESVPLMSLKTITTLPLSFGKKAGCDCNICKAIMEIQDAELQKRKRKARLDSKARQPVHRRKTKKPTVRTARGRKPG